MLRKISLTFTSKVINAVLGFANTILLSQNIGTEGKGVVAIFMSNIALCILVCHIIGGNSIVYLSARYNHFKLLIPCYIWELLSSILVTLILGLTGICPEKYCLELGIVSLLFGLFKTHLFLLLGNEDTKIQNILYPLPAIIQLVVSVVLFKIVHQTNVDSYLYSMYIVFGISYLISLIFIILKVKNKEFSETITLKIVWEMGVKSQTSNVLQFFNNRFAFYVLGYFFIKSEVGIYSVAIALIEVVFLIGNSIGLIVYTKISNLKNQALSKSLANQYLKISFVLSVFSLSIMALVPEEIYGLVFGIGFNKVKTLILYLSPGAAMMSIFLITSSYFSGTGKFQINNYAGLVGCFVMTLGSLLFIPKGNIETASMITSASFISITAYSLWVFKSE